MNWSIALVVALLTGITTAFVTAPVADKVTKMHGVSDFEGGRGMAIAFLFIPAGFVGGALLGLLGTKLVHATEWVHFWKAAGLSVLLGQVALFGISGLSLLAIPRPPTQAGVPLALEVEVLVPMARITEQARQQGQIKLSLYAGPKDNHYFDVDTALYRTEGDLFIVPAKAELLSRSYTRTISFHIGEHTWLAFDLPLPASPELTDAWSEPALLREANTGSTAVVWSDVRLRYRVVALEKKTGPA